MENKKIFSELGKSKKSRETEVSAQGNEYAFTFNASCNNSSTGSPDNSPHDDSPNDDSPHVPHSETDNPCRNSPLLSFIGKSGISESKAVDMISNYIRVSNIIGQYNTNFENIPIILEDYSNTIGNANVKAQRIIENSKSESNRIICNANAEYSRIVSNAKAAANAEFLTISPTF